MNSSKCHRHQCQSKWWGWLRFTYCTTVAGCDSVVAGAGINAQIGRHWMLGAYYNIDFASSTAIDHIVSANLSYSF